MLLETANNLLQSVQVRAECFVAGPGHGISRVRLSSHKAFRDFYEACLLEGLQVRGKVAVCYFHQRLQLVERRAFCPHQRAHHTNADARVEDFIKVRDGRGHGGRGWTMVGRWLDGCWTVVWGYGWSDGGEALEVTAIVENGCQLLETSSPFWAWVIAPHQQSIDDVKNAKAGRPEVEAIPGKSEVDDAKQDLCIAEIHYLG